MKKNDPISDILSSRKYRDVGIPEETLRSLLELELEKGRTQKEAVKAVRQKLHNIIAPYLGDPDYEEAARGLEQAVSQGPEQVKQTCQEVLAQHASTHERQPIVEEFYRRIFDFTGKPDVILDLACGLNPLSFPWMGLPATVRYHAYDLHQPRIQLVNRFFALMGLPPLAEVRDILLSPPEIEAPVAFFFKEAHRFEQRQHGCNTAFWKALRVRYLLVSLPTTSLDGRRNLLERQRRLVYGTIGEAPWKVTEMIFDTELVFCIDKTYGT